MKNTLSLLAFLTGFAVFSTVEAYPWLNFRQGQEKGILEIEGLFSQFESKDSLTFIEVNTDYSNSTLEIDAGFSWLFDGKIFYPPRMSSLAVIFPDFFKNLTMSLGFKDTVWSESDRYWNYGLFQPRYMPDHFRPVQMGIPGVYFDYKQENSSAKLLVSWVHYPDIQNRFDLAEGRMASKNPFDKSFNKSFNSLSWENIPNEKWQFQMEHLLEPSVIFQLRHSLHNSKVAFSYAYKPINRIQYEILPAQLNPGSLSDIPSRGDSSVNLHISQASELEQLNVDDLPDMPNREPLAPSANSPVTEPANPPTAQALGPTNPDRVRGSLTSPTSPQVAGSTAPQAHPIRGQTSDTAASGTNLQNSEKAKKSPKITKIKDFNYYLLSHHLISLEGEITFSERASLLGGIFYELPEQKNISQTWWRLYPAPNLNLSLVAFFEEKINNQARALFTLGWTRTLKDQSREEGRNQILEGGNLLFQHALSASVEYQDKNLLQGFLARFRANHALDNGFNLLSLEKELNLFKSFRLIAGGDLIFHLSKGRKRKQDSSYIGAYNNLSRFLVGGKYVF